MAACETWVDSVRATEAPRVEITRSFDEVVACIDLIKTSSGSRAYDHHDREQEGVLV